MKLANLTWSTYRVPFRGAFLTAHGALSHRRGAIVTLRTDAGYTGHGEIAPLPEHSGASLDTVLSALPILTRELRGRELTDILRFLATQNGGAETDTPRFLEIQDGGAETEVSSVSTSREAAGKLPKPSLRDGSPEASSGSPECSDGAGLRLGPGLRRLPAALLCGLETALLDALAQERGVSLAALLSSGYLDGEEHLPGTPRANVPVNAVIGGETKRAFSTARAAVKAGFSCLKLKLTESSQAEVERVAAIRVGIGPAPGLRLDANEGWSFEQALWMLDQCAAYDIQYVEQPLPASDLTGMARLRRVSPIPLAADEVLTGLSSARRILDAEAADVLILKPQLAGGLRACRQIIQEASRRNVACVITSTLEAGIGVAAALHLAAASPEVTLSCGLATLDLLEDDLLRDDLVIEQGYLRVLQGAGLGVQVDWDALQRYGESYYVK